MVLEGALQADGGEKSSLSLDSLELREDQAWQGV